MNIKMSLRQYIRFYTSSDSRNPDSSTLRQISSNLNNSIGWRGALAFGDGSFRKNGTYDTFEDSRRSRRRIERSVAKAYRRGKL